MVDLKAWSRWLVLFRYNRRNLFRAKFQTALFALCFFYPVFCLFAIYLAHNLDFLQKFGAAGIPPVYAALCAGKRVGIANKEVLVMAGELMPRARALAAQLAKLSPQSRSGGPKRGQHFFLARHLDLLARHRVTEPRSDGID